MYRITYAYRGLQGLLRVEGLKTSPGMVELFDWIDHDGDLASVIFVFVKVKIWK